MKSWPPWYAGVRPEECDTSDGCLCDNPITEGERMIFQIIHYNPNDINALAIVQYEFEFQEDHIAQCLAEFHDPRYKQPENFCPLYL